MVASSGPTLAPNCFASTSDGSANCCDTATVHYSGKRAPAGVSRQACGVHLPVIQDVVHIIVAQRRKQRTCKGMLEA